MPFTLDDLETLIRSRVGTPPEQSYTAKLLGRPSTAAKKLGEEAVEAVIAAVERDRVELVKESADLLYHLLVVLRIAGIDLAEVEAELGRRTAQSGLDEKASRPKA